jgi:hypothetical protein
VLQYINILVKYVFHLLPFGILSGWATGLQRKRRWVLEIARNASLKRGLKPIGLTPPQTGLPKTLESGLLKILWVMYHLAESSSQSFSSRFGSISGCRSKVFLSPACGGVESSAEPIMEIPRFSEGLQ